MINQQTTAKDVTKRIHCPSGNFEQENTVGTGQVHDIHHLKMGKHSIAVLKTTPNLQSTVSTHYLHQDHLDSVAMITNEQGEVVERNHYDTFGQLRSGILNQEQQARVIAGLAIQNAFNAITDRGFTNHRQLKGVDLIHMGGRVYDPHLGRFLSADPNIQAPLNTQSLNRYSYVLNNPLSLNDPTGYFFSWLKKLFKKIIKAIKRIIKRVVAIIIKVIKFVAYKIKKIMRAVKKYARIIVTIAVTIVVAIYAPQFIPALAEGMGGAVATGALAGGVGGLISTGSLKGMLEGAVFGAITGGFAKSVQFGRELGKGVFSGLQNAAKFTVDVTRVIGHGAIGGLRALRGGGKFLTGFASGAFGKIATFGTSAINSVVSSPFAQGLVVATAGGLVSQFMGGSFEMGFITAGAGFATNELLAEDTNLNRAVRSGLNKAEEHTDIFDYKRGDQFRSYYDNLPSGSNIYSNGKGGYYAGEADFKHAAVYDGWVGQADKGNPIAVAIHEPYGASSRTSVASYSNYQTLANALSAPVYVQQGNYNNPYVFTKPEMNITVYHPNR